LAPITSDWLARALERGAQLEANEDATPTAGRPTGTIQVRGIKGAAEAQYLAWYDLLKTLQARRAAIGPELSSVLGALVELLAGGEVDVTITHRGDPAVARELQKRLAEVQLGPQQIASPR
jgi:hypothetical protein